MGTDLSRRGNLVVDSLAGIRSAGFLPVCSYSNRLQSRVGASDAIELLARNFSAATILVADELQRINLQLRGAASEDAFRNSDIAGSNSLRMYESLVKSKKFSTVSIIRLSKLRLSPEFRAAESSILDELYSVDRFRTEARKFASWASRRFGWRDDSSARELEMQYLNLEIATSVFMAELGGYPFEVWQDRPSPLAPDPLAVAYNSSGDELRRALGKSTLDRKLLSLDSLARAAVA